MAFEKMSESHFAHHTQETLSTHLLADLEHSEATLYICLLTSLSVPQ